MKLSSVAHFPHLFIDISAHGLGHLAQVAPVLNALVKLLPKLRLTIQSLLAKETLEARIFADFTHIQEAADFGFVMHDSVRVDYAISAQKYRDFHQNFAEKANKEAQKLRQLSPDFVLTNAAYLPLAAAKLAGISAVSMCSLNWADLFFDAFLTGEKAAQNKTWADKINAEILDSYNAAEVFFSLTPAMPMPRFSNLKTVLPLASKGISQRKIIEQKLKIAADKKLVLAAFGGFAQALNFGAWHAIENVHWLVPEIWLKEALKGQTNEHKNANEHANCSAFESFLSTFPFIDLLSSVDAVLTKPGYGTFVEAAFNQVGVLYIPRENWREQDALIAWLHKNARAVQILETECCQEKIAAQLKTLWQQKMPPKFAAEGATEIAQYLAARLT